MNDQKLEQESESDLKRLLGVEVAKSKDSGEIIGLRLSTHNDKCLIFADGWEGFRVGDAFRAGINEEIVYEPVNLSLNT